MGGQANPASTNEWMAQKGDHSRVPWYSQTTTRTGKEKTTTLAKRLQTGRRSIQEEAYTTTTHTALTKWERAARLSLTTTLQQVGVRWCKPTLFPNLGIRGSSVLLSQPQKLIGDTKGNQNLSKNFMLPGVRGAMRYWMLRVNPPRGAFLHKGTEWKVV